MRVHLHEFLGDAQVQERVFAQLEAFWKRPICMIVPWESGKWVAYAGEVEPLPNRFGFWRRKDRQIGLGRVPYLLTEETPVHIDRCRLSHPPDYYKVYNPRIHYLDWSAEPHWWKRRQLRELVMTGGPT